MAAKLQFNDAITLDGIIGCCGSREVFLGFAPAGLLHQLSFADILNEETGKGYQRRFSEKHSLDFRRYIQKPSSTTIPLTFNLRPRTDRAWKILRLRGNRARINVSDPGKRIFAQVDCQHRLGHLADLQVSLPFMTFIALAIREEMQIFDIINGKAKGLSTSLIDFHESQLAEDLSSERPELYISLKLNEEASSPWYKQLDLGGNRTSGLKRRASLRTMQKAVKRFLRETNILKMNSVDEAYSVIEDFWQAISLILEKQWNNPRKHFLTKGIGVYTLSSLAGLLYLEAGKRRIKSTKSYFLGVLSDFITEIDWSTDGSFRGFGGESGVDKAFALITQTYRKGKNLRIMKRKRIILVMEESNGREEYPSD